jgi:hypothetical protein
VDNQYCETSKGGIYHSNLYPFNGKCQTNSYSQYFSPVKLAVPANTCYVGFKIEYCKKGPCFAIGDEEDTDLITAPEVAEVFHQYLRLGDKHLES